jgi:hypothetical protein
MPVLAIGNRTHGKALQFVAQRNVVAGDPFFFSVCAAADRLFRSASYDIGVEDAMTQLDSTVISALRTVLDDVCRHLPPGSVSLRTDVASRILQCAHVGEQTYEELRQAGLQALRAAPGKR